MTLTATPLRTAAKFIRGITFKPDDVCSPTDQGAVVCMRTKNVQADIDLSDLIAIPEAFVRRAEQNLIEGDLLVSSANSWNLVGKACWVPKLSYRATAGGFISILRCDRESVYPRYFYHWVTSGQTQHDLRKCGRQTTNISNLDFDRALDLEIPLPSLAEQKRIAAILDKADAIRRKLQQSLRLSDDFLRSVFLDMFGDPVTNPKRWDDGSVLGDIAEIVSGVTKGRKLDGKKTREIPYLAVANVQDKRLNLEAVKTIPATNEEIQKYRLVKNDLLLTEGGDPDKLGRGTLWNDELAECIHQNHIFRVRLTHPEIHPVFLNWLVGSERGKKYFLRSAKQTTGIASINMTQLRAFPMLIPPLLVQKQFAALIQAVAKKTMKLTLQARAAENLFSSLQQRAFRGEL